MVWSSMQKGSLAQAEIDINIDSSMIPVLPESLHYSNDDAMDCALYGGEDYVLYSSHVVPTLHSPHGSFPLVRRRKASSRCELMGGLSADLASIILEC